ncbi:hypothetical protein V6N11_047621 [Hibiscus sabdariffa]|uniref:Protein CHUP1, chloroplastic n=1 Tax=Hibiscus sabdariffa TaxID=183260 RepID=A0ABR2NL04_9ROSI
MLKEKRDSNPLLVKFGVAAVAVSFAGFLCSRLRTLIRFSDSCGEADSGEVDDRSNDDFRASKISTISDTVEVPKQQTDGSRSTKHDDGDVFFLTQFNDLIEEFDFSDVVGASLDKEVEIPRSDLDASRTFRTLGKDDEQEIEHLRNAVRVLREKVQNLEVQLLEYYGLKEQETAVSELQNRLKINNMEAKLFRLKIESLQSEKQRLEGQVADHAKAVAELESARSKIKVLEEKLRHEAELNKEQILNLQKRVARLQEQELEAPKNNPDIESKLKRLKVLECEVEELRESNTRLQIENSELARKLESTQIPANPDLEDTKRKAIDETNNRLRQENEELTKQIEQLQSNRCADVEELVYLRWINSCLRPKSEVTAKRLIQYAHTEGMDSMDFDFDQWSSSQASETRELDDSSVENSSATKSTNSGKKKFLKNLRRLIRRKDGKHSDQASSTSKTDHPDIDDPLSWSLSTANDSLTMLRSRSERVATPSQSSSRTSSDVPRWRSMNDEHITDVEKMRSELSSYGYKRFILGKDDDDGSNFPLEPEHVNDSDSLWKSESVKLAEIFEGLRTVKIHKKSASII